MRSRIFSVLLLFLVMLSISPTSVYCLEGNEIELEFSWSKQKYYQGEVGNSTISLQSNSSQTLKFTTITLYFPGYYYYPLDLRYRPITIPAEGKCIFPTIFFNIPLNAPVGLLNFRILMQLEENDTSGWSSHTWVSPNYYLEVNDIKEKEFCQMSSSLAELISEAQAASFQSSISKILLQQGLSERDSANQLGQQGNWSEAIEQSKRATSLIEQALESEQQYWKEQAFESIVEIQSKIEQTSIVDTEGKDLFSEASERMIDAQKAYNNSDYKTAIELTDIASSLLEQALNSEQKHNDQTRWVIYIALPSILVIILAVVGIVLLRTRRGTVRKIDQ